MSPEKYPKAYLAQCPAEGEGEELAKEALHHWQACFMEEEQEDTESLIDGVGRRRGGGVDSPNSAQLPCAVVGASRGRAGGGGGE